SYTLISYCTRSAPSKSSTTWPSATSAAASVMCSVKAMRVQSIATKHPTPDARRGPHASPRSTLLRTLAAGHTHLPRQAREEAGPLVHQRGADLHGAGTLGERPGDVVAGSDAADRDHVETRTGFEHELLEPGELVPRNDEPEVRL